ncbi:MAG: hypothetical protein GC178_03775 [Flavobacteriales bacterium]|nr:hypothetical protein [Flavobacteriales bacterium]
MSDSKIDYVNPYATLAQQHKDGLDAIITSIGAGGPGSVTIDDLIDAVYDYMSTVYTELSSAEGENTTRASIANAINGYIDNGGSSPFLSSLQRVPAVSLGNQFDRLFDASGAASHLKGNAGRLQMVLALGEADAEYWGDQIATSGSWSPYLTTNSAIDTSNIPYWVDAAMFGAQFDYYQVNATDSMSTSLVFLSALIGSLAVVAGKVVFGWVPKNVGILGSSVRIEECNCNGGGSEMMIGGGDMSHIGRPIGRERKPNTKWHTEGTSNKGSDTRFYTSHGWCRTFSGEGAPPTEGPGCGYD